MDDISPQIMIVKAFDGSKRNILGEVVLPLEIGLSNFEVLFQVMDIDSAYTMLLGRPWINDVGVVAFTLQQKVKYIENGSVIMIHGEEILVSKLVSMPYMENAEQVKSNLWHSFEVVELESHQGRTLVHSVNQWVAQIMAKNGYQEGRGLGLKLQCIRLPVLVLEKPNRFGLGYEASLEERMGAIALGRKNKKEKRRHIPHLKETFPVPAEVIIAKEVKLPQCRLTTTTLDNEKAGECNLIHYASGDEMLRN